MGEIDKNKEEIQDEACIVLNEHGPHTTDDLIDKFGRMSEFGFVEVERALSDSDRFIKDTSQRWQFMKKNSGNETYHGP